MQNLHIHTGLKGTVAKTGIKFSVMKRLENAHETLNYGEIKNNNFYLIVQ